MHESENRTALEDAVAAFTRAMDELAAGWLDRARVSMADAVRRLSASLGPTAPDVANALLGAVQIERAAGELRAARTHAAAVAAAAADWPSADRDVLALRLDAECCLAVCDQELGDLDEAERRLLDALELAAGSGAGDRSLLMLTIALGVTYKFAGRLDEAFHRYEQAHVLIKRAEPADPESLAALHHNLAGLAHSRGEAPAGIAWAERGIAVRRAHGLEGVALARDLGGLGALQHLAGELDAAARSYDAAERIFREHQGVGPTEVAVLDANRAALAADRGDVPAAVVHYRRADAALSGALGPDHADVRFVREQLRAISG